MPPTSRDPHRPTPRPLTAATDSGLAPRSAVARPRPGSALVRPIAATGSDRDLLIVTGLIAQPGGRLTHAPDTYAASLRQLVATGLPTLLYLDAALPPP